MRDDAHAKPRRAARDLPADASHSDETERLPTELAADELRACPLPCADAAVGVDDAAEDGQRERKGVLGGGDDVAEGRIHDVDAAGSRRGHVDVVHPDTRPTYYDEALCGVEDGRLHFCLAPYDRTISVPN